MSPKVSVNIACYNHEAFIGEAIKSVLNQTFQDFEIIICNNGSTDNSLKIIESFDDPRIKVESVYPNQQSTYAGANCVSRGCGEYVALLCSDDAWEPDKLEKQVKYLDEHKSCGVVFTRVQPFDEGSNYSFDKNNFYNKHFNILKNRSRFEWLHEIFLTSEHSFCCSSACVRRECFDKLGNFDIRAKHIQDFIIWTNILCYYEVHILDEKLTKMRYFKTDANLGSLSDNTIICSLNEMYLLFKCFAHIKDIDTFLNVFPETKKYFLVLKSEYIPFYLALLTLKTTDVINFRDSAMHLLYDYMGDETNRKNLEKYFGFSYMNLYDIATDFDATRHIATKQNDIFHIILNPIISFIQNHILGIWIDKDMINFKILGILKTHIRFKPKEKNKSLFLPYKLPEKK